MKLTMYSNMNRAFDMRNNDEKISGTTVKSCIRVFSSFDSGI